jgi:tetratricopeptide (TPR) repeat protein
MAEKTLKVVISSTVVDLPDYRSAAMAACLERDIHPKMMEHMTALNAAAIKASLDLVDQSDVYLGIFAHRYGYIPEKDNLPGISITEMEYNRAVEFEMPRLIFLIKENYPFDPSLVDKGDKAVKLEALKEKLSTERVVKIFTSPEDLRGHIISALVELEKAVDTLKPLKGPDIPVPPEKYVTHPYTLLQTDNLIGRKAELSMLSDWVANPDSDTYGAHILNIIAMGGMGKSALTWEWFNKKAPEEMKPLAGRMWWSFYELDARFENFVSHALAYVSGRPVEEIRREIPAPERETRLLDILNKEPFLLVFDGFERELVAYERIDVSHLDDSESRVPKSLRKTSDPRVGKFLRKLAQVKRSRVLISSRLLLAELETDTGRPRPGVARHDLESLPDDEAVEMWQKLGVRGPRNVLLPVFRSFGKHTLVIQALAGEVVKYRRGPGNFEKWLEANPAFDLTKFDNIKDKVEHVLEFALRGVGETLRTVLGTLTAFRVLPDYGIIAAVLAGDDKPCKDEHELDAALTELEDRGLVGWDKRANRYDLHPIVRGVVWSGLDDDAKKGVYSALHAHFEAVPMVEFDDVKSLEDLTPAIEMYHTLIGMGRYDEAEILFYDRLSKAMLYRLSVGRQRAEMLEMLFPDGLDDLPRLSRQDMQSFTLNSLALGYQYSGQPGRAAPLVRRAGTIASERGDNQDFSVGLSNLADTLRMTGNLRESEGAARQALEIARQLEDRVYEALSLYMLGLALPARGEAEESKVALRRSLGILVEQNISQAEGVVNACIAQRAIWFGKHEEVRPFADRAWDLAHVQKNEWDFIRAARMQGEAALGLDDLDTAGKRLHVALTRARTVNRAEEELPALTALAEMERRQGDEKAARELLEDIWEYAERGPYPMFHADALNVLAQIERDAGNTDKAIEAATRAYQLAWCDGPPYAYHWGLIKAQKHLDELGAPIPAMPPFDESKFEPMPEVEIDPDDEFHVGES